MNGISQAIEYAKGLMDNGMSSADANVEVVRMVGVRLIIGGRDRSTRNALMAGVKDGRLGHLKKDKHKPEAFFHPNSEGRAKEKRNQAQNEALRAIASVCTVNSL